MRPARRPAARRGLTLLELLIALSLLSVLLVAVLGLQRRTIDRAVDLRSSVPCQIAADRSLRHASDAFEAFLNRAAEPVVSIDRGRRGELALTEDSLGSLVQRVDDSGILTLESTAAEQSLATTRLLGGTSENTGLGLMAELDEERMVVTVEVITETQSPRERPLSARILLNVSGSEVSNGR